MKSSHSQNKVVCVPHMILGLRQGYGNSEPLISESLHLRRIMGLE